MTNDMNPTPLNCPTCNAPLDFDGIHPVIRCKFCGNNSVVPVSLLDQQSAPSFVWEEIVQLVQNGNLEQAQNRFQNSFGTNAQDSREAINALASGRTVNFSTSNKYSAPELLKIMEQVQKLVADDSKAEAAAIYENTFNMNQEQARQVINQIANWKQNQTFNPYTTIPPQYSISPQKKTNSLAIVIPLILLIVVGVLVIVFTDFAARHYVSTQTTLLLNDIDGTGQSIASTFYDPNAETNFMGLVDTASGKLIWKSDPISEQGTSFFISSEDTLYGAYGTHLYAFHTADGSILWQTEMSDSLVYSSSPMLITSGRLIVLTNDRNITAYEAEAGRQIWTRQQSAYDSILRLVGNSLLIRDYLPGTYDESLFLINPITGNQENVITPKCEISSFPDFMDSSTGIALADNSNSLFIVFDSGCVQCIDLESGQLMWNTMDEKTFTNIYQGFTPLMTNSDFYFGNGGSLVKVNQTNGSETILITTEDYNLVPLAQIEDNLILRAKRTRGTTAFELWGINSETGTLLWQKNLKNADPIDPPDKMSGLITDTNRGWTWRVINDKFLIVTFFGEPNQIEIETLDPADGSISATQILPIDKINGDFYSIPAVIGWEGSTAFLNLDYNLYSLDLSSMELRKIY